MAPAANALPCVATDLNFSAFHKSVVRLGHLGHHVGVVRHTRLNLLLVCRIVPTVICKKSLCAGASKIRGACAGEQSRLVFGGVHVQRRVELLTQPVRQAHVIGVHVGYHHAQNGQALHGACKNLAPGFLRARVGDAAIYRGPAVSKACGRFFAVFQEP